MRMNKKEIAAIYGFRAWQIGPLERSNGRIFFDLRTKVGGKFAFHVEIPADPAEFYVKMTEIPENLASDQLTDTVKPAILDSS